MIQKKERATVEARPYQMWVRAICIPLMLVLLGALLAQPADAKKRKKAKAKRIERVETGTYRGPAVGTSTSSMSICHGGLAVGCTPFEVQPKERFIRVEVNDLLGQPVAARVAQYGPQDTQASATDDFCQTTEEPVRLMQATTAIAIFVFAGDCVDGTTAMATTGEITATFSNLP